MDKKKYYKISDIASLLQITPRTIRYYEQEGLLNSVVRTAGGMRLFAEKDIALIKKIKDWQKNEAYSLEKIKEILAAPQPQDTDPNEKIAIITDSTASLPKIAVDDLEIFTIPLYITIDGKTYKDGVDITAIDFFSLVKGNNYKAVSAPPTVEDFTELYNQVLSKGFTKIISIHLSGKWSKTSENAKKAAQMFQHKIDVIDSFNTGLGLGLQVYSAALLARQKKTVLALTEDIKEKRNRCWQTIYINSLDFFTQSIDKSTIQGELLGSLLDYRPVLFYDPSFGRFQVIDRSNNINEALDILLKSIKEYDKINGRVMKYIGITHSYFYQEAFEFMKRIKNNFPHVSVIISEASPILNTYVGFYSMGIAIC